MSYAGITEEPEPLLQTDALIVPATISILTLILTIPMLTWPLCVSARRSYGRQAVELRTLSGSVFGRAFVGLTTSAVALLVWVRGLRATMALRGRAGNEMMARLFQRPLRMTAIMTCYEDALEEAAMLSMHAT